MYSSSSYRNWLYDVFPSFSGEDIRKTFLSHLLKELDRKLISVFKDSEIQRSHSIAPELVQAIRGSKIAVVVVSKNYASSSWCLNELLEIVKCKGGLCQVVIPIFYGLDPSDVRKQSGDFGESFEKTCKNKTEDEKRLWRKALTDVANILGYHYLNWDNEATMTEAIVNDVLCKLNFTTSQDFKDFVGIEDHIAEMSLLLRLESNEVRMVGIWGPSGIGKTTIARALFSRISPRFQGSIYLDKAFMAKNLEIYSKANPDDHNMKLHLQDDRMLLDVLVGQTHWFGCGSRIIAITDDRHKLIAHGIHLIYKVGLPSEKLALEMFCQSAFGQTSPPKGFEKLASEVAVRAGCLPLGLKVIGSYMRGRKQEDWIHMLPRLQRSLDGKIEKALRVSYDGLLSWVRCPLSCMPSTFCPKNLVKLKMPESKLEKLWEGAGSLACLKEMDLEGSEKLREIPDLSMATNLETLNLRDCSSLVEIYCSSVRNLNKVRKLDMKRCTKLKNLPTGINLESLRYFDLSGCSRLRRFPDISRNISKLHLNQTGIVKVPWWIEDFTRLEFLFMKDCNKLKHISLNISKLQHLEFADFTDCRRLTEASWHYHPSRMISAEIDSILEFDFMNCLNLDQEALLQQNPVFKLMILPGEKVPPYFVHQTTTGNSLAIPTFLCEPCFRIRACAVVDAVSKSTLDFTHVAIQTDDVFPLADVVDIKFCLTSDDSLCKIKGCGLRDLMPLSHRMFLRKMKNQKALGKAS
ncbi:unnamed protein product [Microthlaspi erraticum]|uniref:ADP-ribosyl cyclase/cyclic ADP-ribose hydrolase n=1 Tax=Microthlaspi erraticum TaxID=1685480 RepID=A0A6D2IJ16_9BRAS|nr:unnamed protein product [Microthlaspi erraticum]